MNVVKMQKMVVAQFDVCVQTAARLINISSILVEQPFFFIKNNPGI
jgi:hypothetical protein